MNGTTGNNNCLGLLFVLLHQLLQVRLRYLSLYRPLHVEIKKLAL